MSVENKKIVIKDLTKSFENTPIFSSFSANISGNTAIMGVSGKGKTTLVRIITGLDTDFEGSVDFDFSPEFSVVFQQDRLFDGFSALENVTAAMGKGRFDKDAREKAKAILSSLLISPEDQLKRVRDFSGGMRRRVALARALAASGNVLVLDEPYKGLDEKTRAHCAAFVKECASDRLILLVTHDRAEAELMGIENFINV